MEAYNLIQTAKLQPKQAVATIINQKKLDRSLESKLQGAVGSLIKKAKREKETEKKGPKKKEKKVKPRAEDEDPEESPHEDPYIPNPMLGMEGLGEEALQGAKRELVRKVSVTFDAIVEKIVMDDYRRALFSMWKRDKKFEGDLGDLLVDAFDEFMKLRGVDLEYVVRKPTIKRRVE